MDNFDLIQEKILIKQADYENYQDDYRRKQRKLDEDYQDADNVHMAIRQLVDQKAEDYFTLARQEHQDITEGRAQFFDLLDHLSSEAEWGFIRKRNELDEIADDLEQTYKSNCRKYEDQLEELFIQRRRAYEEELTKDKGAPK